jgi:SH3-like domain-containing protein
MKAKLLLILSCFAWMIPGFAEEPADIPVFEVMVVADRVNLRNAGSLDSDVIGQVNYGDMLTGLELTEEWVRVRAPETLAVWVHGGLLFEDREVRARVLNMRTGPGTQFDVLGQLERMDPVTVLERYDEWRRIRATDAVQVWIFRELVQLGEMPVAQAEPAEQADPETVPEAEESAADPEPVDAETPAPLPVDEEADDQTPEEEADGQVDHSAEAVEDVADEEPLPLVEVDPAPEVVKVVEEVPAEEMVEAPQDVPLVPLQGQGTASVRRGWVKTYVIAGTAPTRFQLVFRERGREEALAYLYGDEDEIRALSGQPVLVRGRDFWVAGARIPLMRIESIERDRETGR